MKVICPRCECLMDLFCASGEHNGPNGGRLMVMECMETCTEGYDTDIEMWKCPNCYKTVYVTGE